MASMVDNFKEALLRWIIGTNIAFSAVESDYFRVLLCQLWPNIDKFISRSGGTIRNWVMNEYTVKKTEIKRQLKEEAVSVIYLSFDFWTSPNLYALITVVAYYIDHSYTIQTRFIVLRRLHGSHNGENTAVLLAKIINEYEFADQIGYFTLDNASSNDTCVNEF